MHMSHHPLSQFSYRFDYRSSVKLHSRLYLLRYTSEILRGLFRRHRPQLRAQVQPTRYGVRLSKKDLANWHDFVNRQPDQVPAPLTYYGGAGAFGLFDLLAQLRINFSTILHLRGKVEILDGVAEVDIGDEFTLEMQLEDVILRKRQCILVVSTLVRNRIGEAVRRHEDFWFVRNCNPRYMQELCYPHRYDGKEFEGISRRESQLFSNPQAHLQSLAIVIPENAGQSYARVSGDYNVIHTTGWGARLCGQKKAFLQGFGVMNLCLHHITQLLEKAPASFSITYCRPTFVDQEVVLVLSDRRFELCDGRGQLLCFGEFSL